MPLLDQLQIDYQSVPSTYFLGQVLADFELDKQDMSHCWA